MKVAIVGSRDLSINIDGFIPVETTCIISGGAIGIDTQAENYADAHGIPTIIIRPEYEKYGKQAPLVRNKRIVESADCVLAFWDGKSRGTSYTIDYAKKIGKPVRIYVFLRP